MSDYNDSKIFTDSKIIHSPIPLPEKPKKENVYYFLVAGAATIVVLAGIRAASGIVGPILLALFLTIILLVPLRWLQKKGVPNVLALPIVLGATVVVFIGLGYFVGKSLNDFSKSIPSYRNRIIRKLDDLEKKVEQLGFALGTVHFDFDMGKDEPDTGKDLIKEPNEKEPTQVSKTTPEESVTPTDEFTPRKTISKHPESLSDVEDGAEPKNGVYSDDHQEAKEETAHGEKNLEDFEDPEESADFQEMLEAKNMEKPSLVALDAKSVMYWVTWALVELRHLAEGGFLVLIFTIFMIFEASRFPEKVDRAFGKEGPISNKHFHRIADDIRRYLFLKAISSLMSATAATFVYWIFGVPATLFWGVVAFFLYFIPNVGGTLAAIFPGLLIFMTYDIEGVLLYAVCLIAIECAIAYGIEPKMLGHGLGIATVVIILSLVFWGWILGPIGLFLAAPLTIMVKIILQAFKETEWVAILLSDKAR